MNERAHRQRVLPGMAYAAGLALASGLCAATVEPDEIQKGVEKLTERLRVFTAEIEPSPEEPGVFWLNASGLDLLQPSLRRWAKRIHSDLTKSGFLTRVVVGSTRFGTYSIAKARGRHQVRVFESDEHERRTADRVPLNRLGMRPKFRDALHKLGIDTVGGFVRLPATGILERYGPEAYRLHRLASGEAWTPLDNRPEEVVHTTHIELDHAESHASRLLFIVKRLLHPMLAELADGHEALAALTLDLRLENKTSLVESIRPATPTLDEAQMLDLVRLRLESLALEAGATTVRMTVDAIRATTEQLQLFQQKPRRDRKAARRAFARLRAEYGDDVVSKARLTDGHLPEATFSWTPIDDLPTAEPRTVTTHPLIRRVLERPRALPPQSHNVRNDGWLLSGLEQGAVVNLCGPYIISGGWWVTPVHREYHFAETKRGDILWVYYDRKRRRWFLQGVVE